jgi:DNA-directed RNA polymerase alpha subunit
MIIKELFIMTARNVEIMDAIVNELTTKTFSKALKTVYVKRTVVIPFKETDLDIPIETLQLQARTSNALRRTHLNTVNDVVEYGNKNGFKNIRNFGVNCGVELFEAILDWCWDHMNIDQKTQFLIDTVERNVDNIRV